MCKRHDAATFIFAVRMEASPAKATFQIRDIPSQATVRVIGENRTIAVRQGSFEDDFQPHEVHLYRVQ